MRLATAVISLAPTPGLSRSNASSASRDSPAASIRVAASVDPAQGGNLNLLRDGGIGGNPAYVYNTSGAPAFSDRLQELVDGMNASRAQPNQELQTSATLLRRAATEPAFYQDLRRRTVALQPLVAPGREAEAWAKLLADLQGPSGQGS